MTGSHDTEGNSDSAQESDAKKEQERQVPRTDICEECEWEIECEVDKVTGKHELIHQAREAEEGFTPVTGGTVTVSFSCRCSSAKIEYGPGSASAWDIPDAWMWEDEINA